MHRTFFFFSLMLFFACQSMIQKTKNDEQSNSLEGLWWGYEDKKEKKSGISISFLLALFSSKLLHPHSFTTLRSHNNKAMSTRSCKTSKTLYTNYIDAFEAPATK